jgi:hypothetical protein
VADKPRRPPSQRAARGHERRASLAMTAMYSTHGSISSGVLQVAKGRELRYDMGSLERTKGVMSTADSRTDHALTAGSTSAIAARSVLSMATLRVQFSTL